VVIPILVWWLLFILLSVYGNNRFQLLNIVGFLFLAIVPGLLTVIALKIKHLPFWGYAGLTIGFSLLELMMVGLLGNTLLPFFGIARPLDKAIVLIEVYLLTATLVAVVWFRIRQIEINLKRYAIFDRPRDFILSFTPALFVLLSIFGAIRLNNGGSNILTMIMLGGMTVYLIILLACAKRLDANTIPTAIFFLSAALLLMTDLRGWYITGHDIQSEYKVFEMTKLAGIWNIASYRDAYNACMSITILPTLFSNLLSVPDPYIYKFFFQIFFAICPVFVYLIGHQWTNRRISLLGTIYFIGFPTFFTDMPFLVRQEIAFLFFGLMLYIIFTDLLPLRIRRILFMVMGVGVILSHYSTTYTVLAIFGLAAASRPFIIKLFQKLKEARFFRSSAVLASPKLENHRKPNITLTMVIVLFVASFLWTSIITKTGGGLQSVISQTFSAVQDGFTGNNRSVDVTTLLTFGAPDQHQELEDYISQQVNPLRASSTPGTYFASSTYAQYDLVPVGPKTIPLTSLGAFFENHGIPLSKLLALFGQLLAKLTEVFVVLGMLYLLFRKTAIQYVDEEIYLISFYCLVFIGMNIVLPVLSTQYGIFRAMQQSMFLIAPVIVAGAIMLGNGMTEIIRPLKKYLTGELFAMILGVIFFSYSIRFTPYLVGNTAAALHLSDLGTYYDNYLIQANQVYGVNWLTQIIGANTDAANGLELEVQANKYNNFASLTSLSPFTDIMPAVIRRNAYVFLGPITVTQDRATVIFNADQVTYQYPTQFLRDNKNLIYSNGGSQVYY
jgi:uncharacterized membrane protein